MSTEYENEPEQDQEENQEVIDVEDRNDEEEEDIFPFDQEFFVRKLREKPQFPPASNKCGTAWPKKSYQDFKIPLAERLSLQTNSTLDRIRERLPYPRGCVPPLALPTWHYMPLEKKIPLLQSTKDLFYYTRGQLAENLHRKSPVFTLRDPYNRERVLGEPYSSLHDPNVKELLYSPLMRTLLLERGFINEYDEVLCTLREFNRFRDYLRTLYCDEIWGDMEATDAFIKSEREQLQMLLLDHNRKEGKKAVVIARIEAAKKFHENTTEFKRKKQHQKDQMLEARLRQFQTEKERKILESILQGIEAARRNKERLQALHELRLQQRRDIMIKSTRKFLETQERQQNDKQMMNAAYNKFLLEWIESKYVFCYEKLVQKRQIQEDLRESTRYRARKRQLRLENYREQLPAILQKRKAEDERIWGIVRKFAMRWLDRVRARLNAPKDVKHESCWIGSKNVLDETVKYLRQESGYEKLDDFILNIMKLKKQIQAQIELEEAEEAAAALLAAENEESEAEGNVDGTETLRTIQTIQALASASAAASNVQDEGNE